MDLILVRVNNISYDIIFTCKLLISNSLWNDSLLVCVRIHSLEHFKKKYEVDEVFFTDEVCICKHLATEEKKSTSCME